MTSLKKIPHERHRITQFKSAGKHNLKPDSPVPYPDKQTKTGL